MILIYFLTILSESRIETNLIGSHLFLSNGSILFDSKKTLQMPGNLITIPALTRFRIFSIKNLRVNKNIDHLITNSEFLQSFKMNIKNCHFSKFLQSPISMIFDDTCFFQADKPCDVDDFNTSLKNCRSQIIIDNCDRAFTISSCTFNGCASNYSGGAIYIRNSHGVTIKDSTFLDCSTTSCCGGAIYLENTKYNINLLRVSFKNCYPAGNGGGGIYVLNSDYVNLDNLNFESCKLDISYGSYGGGATILNASEVRLHKINSTDCQGSYGSGVCINMYNPNTIPYSSYKLTKVSGEYLYGYDCTNTFGIYSFHYCHFNSLYHINVTDLISHQHSNFLFYFSSCNGTVSYFYIEMNRNERNNAIFYIYNNAEFPKPDPFYSLTLNCVIAESINDSTNLFYYENPAGNPSHIAVHLNNFYAPNINDFSYDTDNEFFVLSEATGICYTVTDSYQFTPSEYFTSSLEFTQTQNFTSTGDFDRSVAFTKSKEFSESDGFTETAPFTPTFNFTASTIFTKSKTLGPVKPTSRVTPKPTFSEYRSQLPRPQMTFYNMGSAEKDGKGTKTDLGLATIYVIIALLVVLLVVVIVFAVINSRKQPVIENNRTFDAPDEFYFPDFEN